MKQPPQLTQDIAHKDAAHADAARGDAAHGDAAHGDAAHADAAHADAARGDVAHADAAHGSAHAAMHAAMRADVAHLDAPPDAAGPHKEAMRKAFFSACAPEWEARNYSPQLKGQVADMVAGLSIGEGHTVLDVGCGQGILLPFVRARTGQSGRLIALDFCADMLKGVAQKDSQALALCASAEYMPLIDNYVDTLLCFSAFPHFADKVSAAREFFRVLKPGAKAHVLHVGGRSFINRLHDMYAAVKGDYLPGEHGMRALFSAAGFVHLHLDESDTHYYFSAQKPGTP